jgi:class 3 adenylate cyclase
VEAPEGSIDPAIAAHHGRIVKRTGDGAIIEFRSVVDAVRCAHTKSPAPTEATRGKDRAPRLGGQKESADRWCRVTRLTF